MEGWKKDPDNKIDTPKMLSSVILITIYASGWKCIKKLRGGILQKIRK
jgi:hypothetical protein